MTSIIVRTLSSSLLLSSLVVAAACGDDDDSEGSGGATGKGGSSAKGGSAGTSGSAEPIKCGSRTCQPLDLKVLGQGSVEACCADGNICGLDASGLEAYGVSFEESCQLRDQPGVLDPNCPDVSTEVPDSGGLVISFKGCCRTDVGKCGYMLDKVAGAIELGLGCVASEPFLDGEPAPDCDPSGEGGSGGAPNAGEGGTSGG